MIRLAHKNTIIFIATLILTIFITFSYAQTGLEQIRAQDTKIWPTKQIDIIRSLYLDENGMPSRDVLLNAMGLYPINETITKTPYFSASFSVTDVKEVNGQLLPREGAQPLHLDFCVKSVKNFRAVNIAKPIRDGRVYEDNNKIIVGGYSSKYNERPAGEIGKNGEFILTLDKNLVNEFPLAQIPAEEIVFDPFEFKLCRLESSNGNPIEEQACSFLPIQLFEKNGHALENIQFQVQSSDNAIIVLLGIVENKNIVLASCDFFDASPVKNIEGYQPELIKGCSQPENGNVVTFTFEGEFSQNIAQNNGMLFIDSPVLTKKMASKAAAASSEKQTIKIDGQFDEWRNIKGISDPQGDYVSYLYPNPDTDILEFKVTNDDQYMYFYSRVAGAHGRTGDTGRYYWYTYIYVDGNPYTGYPPTRDDNCYFGVAIGDDCEAQFEFVGNKFIKTFFGFTGVGTEKEALAGKVKLGPSFYSPKDSQGTPRDRYKVEYVHNKGSRKITHDYTEGTSEDIIIALSPDGSEVEMRVEFKGFLWDESGKQIMYPGRIMNIAVGAEAASDYYGSDTWGADSSPVIYNYEIK